MQDAHILIVEDDPIAGEVLAAWARQHGAHATCAASLSEADAALAAGACDLILSDVHLPGNHRLEWVERILARNLAPPLVLITGNPELETTMRAANLPVAGYLVKPADLTTLSALAIRLIDDHRQRREWQELSREAVVLINQLGPEAAVVGEKLRQLSLRLAESGSHRRRTAPGEELVWRELLVETVATLEKTKHSFRSKDLGRLRLRLEQVLARRDAAA
ncbi:MAG TPA: response regulator [Lacunisphaera sp.]|nr:response regulator [Lacunisphaera sp.]